MDFRVDVIFIGVILFGRLASQPEQWAEKLTFDKHNGISHLV